MVSKLKLRFFNDHKSKALTASVLIHLVLLFIMFFMADLSRPGIEPGYQGILVNFGLPVTYDGQELQETNVPEQMEEMDENVTSNLTEEESPVKVKESSNKPSRQQQRTQKTTEKTRTEDFSSLFSKNTGNKKDANQGDPLGSPGADALRGISKGLGKVGGGLEGRGVLYKPDIIEHSQKSGRVVVEVCIDPKGKVISARFTQKGSTTTDADLVETAEFAAKKYVFAPGDFDKACGTISIQFIVY
jgi:hypothetical protein